jgi:hypothetical protein
MATSATELVFSGWTRNVVASTFAESALPQSEVSASAARRFSPAEREGALTFCWQSGGQIIVHGGRSEAPGRRKVVQASLLTCALSSLGEGWSEVMELREEGAAARYVRGPARWRHAGVLYDASGTMVIHGGKDADGNVCNDVQLFNFRRATWESFGRWAGGCEPPSMFGHAMVALPLGVIVALGPMWAGVAKKRGRGEVPATARKEVMAMYSLDLAGIDKIWRKMAMPDEGSQIPSARRDFSLAATADGATLILAGGEYADVPLDDVWHFGTNTNVWRQLAIRSVGRGLFATKHPSGTDGALVVSIGVKAASVVSLDAPAGEFAQALKLQPAEPALQLLRRHAHFMRVDPSAGEAEAATVDADRHKEWPLRVIAVDGCGGVYDASIAVRKRLARSAAPPPPAATADVANSQPAPAPAPATVLTASKQVPLSVLW